jgi:hypothetical protein
VRRLAISLALVALLVLAQPAGASPLDDYAKRTRASFVAMTDPSSGLPADILNSDCRTSVQTSTTAYLSLDQGMIMAALGNALGDDVLRRAFADSSMERALRPVIGVERFSTAP